jgi:1,4-dihydroxy-2-naphthoate octaprenyltransferase
MLKHWLVAIRPKTLSIAVIPVVVGSVLGWTDSGTMIWSLMMTALVTAVLIQVGTNLHNDAADYTRGADVSETRLGPLRATAEGWLTPDKVRQGAMWSFGLAMLMGSYLVWIGGWLILAVGVASIAAGFAYTGGPKPIAYIGLGELFVFLFFGLVAVAGSYYLQTGGLTGTAVLIGTMIGMPAAAVLVVNNYRDLENDRIVGKNTLAVRFGRRASQIEYGLLMLTPFALLPLLHPNTVRAGWVALPLVAIPWALHLVWRFQHETPGPVFNQLLVGTARFQLVLGFLLCAAILGSQARLTGS